MPLRRPPLALGLIVASLWLTPASALAASTHWQAQADRVAQAVTHAEQVFAKGDVAGGKRAVTEAYFHVFEDTKLESAIRRFVSAKRAAEIERHFATIRKAMGAGNAGEVTSVAQQLREAVDAEAKALDAAEIAPGVFEVNQ